MRKHMKCFNDEIMLFSDLYMKQSWTLSLRVKAALASALEFYVAYLWTQLWLYQVFLCD